MGNAVAVILIIVALLGIIPSRFFYRRKSKFLRFGLGGLNGALQGYLFGAGITRLLEGQIAGLEFTPPGGMSKETFIKACLAGVVFLFSVLRSINAPLRLARKKEGVG